MRFRTAKVVLCFAGLVSIVILNSCGHAARVVNVPNLYSKTGLYDQMWNAAVDKGYAMGYSLERQDKERGELLFKREFGSERKIDKIRVAFGNLEGQPGFLVEVLSSDVINPFAASSAERMKEAISEVVNNPENNRSADNRSANNRSSNPDGGGEKASFLPGIDTEKTIRTVLDKGGEPITSIALSDNQPISKVLVYKREDIRHPILFTYNEQRNEFIYQAMRNMKAEIYDKDKDSEKFNRFLKNWYSYELAKAAEAYGIKDNFEKKYQTIKMLENVFPIAPSAYNDLAWFYATSKDDAIRNGKKAVQYAEKCMSFGIKSAAIYDTLAASYAENGEFEKAVKAQEEAVRLASDKEKDIIQKHLIAYKNNKTYVQAYMK